MAAARSEDASGKGPGWRWIGGGALLALVVLVAAVGIPSSVEAQPKSVTLDLKDGKAKVESQLTKEDALDVKGRKLSYSKAYAVAFDDTSTLVQITTFRPSPDEADRRKKAWSDDDD